MYPSMQHMLLHAVLDAGTITSVTARSERTVVAYDKKMEVIRLGALWRQNQDGQKEEHNSAIEK